MQSAITQLEKDSPNLADVCRLFFNFKYEILKSIDSFPFTLLEPEEMKSIIEVREDFCLKIIHKAAYFLDPRGQGRLRNNDERLRNNLLLWNLSVSSQKNFPLAKCWI